jgi:hypothetical protein
VGLIHPGDEKMHYSDSSHRWLCPDPDADQEAWTDRVRAHVEYHRTNLDHPTPPRQRAGPVIASAHRRTRASDHRSG